MSLHPRANDIIRAVELRGLRPGLWRCSPDLGAAIDMDAMTIADITAAEVPKPTIAVYELRAAWHGHPAGRRFVAPPPTFRGLPVVVDEQLPPNSLILDPA